MRAASSRMTSRAPAYPRVVLSLPGKATMRLPLAGSQRRALSAVNAGASGNLP